jgi:hypothetical protein
MYQDISLMRSCTRRFVPAAAAAAAAYIPLFYFIYI